MAFVGADVGDAGEELGFSGDNVGLLEMGGDVGSAANTVGDSEGTKVGVSVGDAVGLVVIGEELGLSLGVTVGFDVAAATVTKFNSDRYRKQQTGLVSTK